MQIFQGELRVDVSALLLAQQAALAAAVANGAKDAPYQPFTSRGAAEAAVIPESVKYITINGMQYVRDPDGTALTTADGGKWSPIGTASPEHWGAIGDGVTDDTAALQDMIDQTGSLNLAGGTYAATNLTMPDKGRIEGIGTLDFSGRATYANSITAPLILARGSAGADIALTADAASGDTTINLTSTAGISAGDLVEIGTQGHTGGFLDTSVTINNAEQFVVAAVLSSTSLLLTEPVTDESGFAVANGAACRRINSLNDLYIGPDVTIKGKGRRTAGVGDFGVVMFYARRARVHCRFIDVDYSALRFESCYDVLAEGVRIKHSLKGPNNTVNYGIVPSGSSKYVRISKCHLENMRHGVVTSHLSSATLDEAGERLWMRGVVRSLMVSENTFLNTWHAAIATHNDADLVTFERNDIIGCAFGVNVRDRRAAVRNNQFQKCGTDIYLSAHPRDLLVEGNVSTNKTSGNFIDTSLDGLADISGWTIRDNKVSQAMNGRGIYIILNSAVESRNFVISGNGFNDCTLDSANGASISVTGAPIVDLNIANNTFHRIFTGSAVRVDSGTRVLIVGNDVRNCTRAFITSGAFSNSYGKNNIVLNTGTFWSGSSNMANAATIVGDNTVA